MAKFPEPPSVARLRAIRPQLRRLPAGTDLWRIYFAGGVHPTTWNGFRFFGPTDSRFDHQLLPRSVQARGLLYVADSALTCLAEVFQASRTIDRSLRVPRLACFTLSRDLQLLDLASAWVTRAGASTAIHSGMRARARRWSAAIYDAYPHIDGLAYCSSMNANAPALALYERAAGALPSGVRLDRALADGALLPQLDHAGLTLGYALV